MGLSVHINIKMAFVAEHAVLLAMCFVRGRYGRGASDIVSTMSQGLESVLTLIIYYWLFNNQVIRN